MYQRIKKLTIVWFTFAITTALIGNQVTLKFHSFPPMAANSNKKFVEPWGKRVSKASGGEIKIEMYVSMQLGGKPPQLIDQVREGVVDLIWTVAGYTPGRFPRLEVFDLPFIAGSAIATSQAAQEFAEKIAAKDLKDFKVLAVSVHSPGKIHTKNQLIKSVEDLKGLKIRTPNRVIGNMLKELGAVPVGLPVPRIASALSKGVLDGMIVPWDIVPSFKLQELTKAHTTTAGERGLYTTPFLFLMNKAKYQSLTDRQKKAIDQNSGMVLAKLAGELWEQFEKPGRQLAQKAGGKFHTLSGEPLKTMQIKADALVQKWIKQADSKGLDGQKLVRTARSLIEKYEQQ